MIESILPAEVAAAWSTTDPEGVVLYEIEEAAVGNAVDKRRREFTTARWCARRALADLGLPEAPIPSGDTREPIWPDGVVGAITHCHGYRAAAVALRGDIAAVGVDAEPDEPCPPGVLRMVASASEHEMLDRLAVQRPTMSWDRILFSAKESVYKAWFPLTHRWLGFEDADLEIDPDGTFTARIIVDAPYREFSGRWLAGEGLALTAVVVTA